MVGACVFLFSFPFTLSNVNQPFIQCKKRKKGNESKYLNRNLLFVILYKNAKEFYFFSWSNYTNFNPKKLKINERMVDYMTTIPNNFNLTNNLILDKNSVVMLISRKLKKTIR